MSAEAEMRFVMMLGVVCAWSQNPFESGSWIDLSYAFDASTIYWPTAQPFEHETEFEGRTEKGYFYSAYRYSASEHGGTHLDAPIHFAEGKKHPINWN